MKRTIRLTESELINVIKKIINENAWNVKSIEDELKSAQKIHTIEDAKALVAKGTNLFNQIDNVYKQAFAAKNVQSLDWLVAKVQHSSPNSFKDILNAYAKEKGFQHFGELRSSIPNLAKHLADTIGPIAREKGFVLNKQAIPKNNLNTFLDTNKNMQGGTIVLDDFANPEFVYIISNEESKVEELRKILNDKYSTKNPNTGEKIPFLTGTSTQKSGNLFVSINKI